MIDNLQEADSLAAEKASMEAPGISGGDILQLNVGGESFVVTRGTLTQVKLWALLSKHSLACNDALKLAASPLLYPGNVCKHRRCSE